MLRIRNVVLGLGLCAAMLGCEPAPPAAPETPPAPPAETTPAAEGTPPAEGTTSLSPEDQALVDAQVVCMIGGKLGSMGTPIKVEHEGKPYFLCCEGCREPFLADPEKHIAALDARKAAAAAKAE